jgi:outer membrane protein
MRNPPRTPLLAGGRPFRMSVALAALAGGVLGLSPGCSSPMAVQSERDLRRSVLESVQRELAQAREYPEPRVPQAGPSIDVLHLNPQVIPEDERMAGPQSYDRRALYLAVDLYGRPQQVLPITLETAIRATAEYNLQVQFARLQPAISESQTVAAEAAFDWTLFNTTEYNSLDSPTPQTRQGLSTIGNPTNNATTVNNSTGLRRNLTSGGQFTFQNDLNYNDVNTPGVTTSPSPADQAAITLRLDQPLLRGFGSDVTLAQVRINRNAERDSIAALKREMLRQITTTEQAYWNLVQAQFDVLILQRLYDRGVQTRDQVIAREILDATPAQIAQARATVEDRQSQLIRAQNNLRIASDTLKLQMNLPQATVGDETLLLPVDEPVTAPVISSLVDVLATGIRSRPEVQQAILSIDNTSIRQEVADNLRLPRLDLRLQTRYAGLDDDFGSAYDDVWNGHFIDYLVGLNFEQPLGNRAAEAGYRQRRLERMQATIAYRSTVQQVISEMKRAVRNAVTNYRLIEQTKVARYAQAENLRSFQVEKAIIKGFTVETLDFEFRQQESLAQSERDEVAALTDYNVAIAALYASMGTALERNNIQFQIPDAEDPLPAGGLDSPRNAVVAKSEPAYVAPPPPRGSPWPWKKAPDETAPGVQNPGLITVPEPSTLNPPPRAAPPGPNIPAQGTPRPPGASPATITPGPEQSGPVPPGHAPSGQPPGTPSPPR